MQRYKSTFSKKHNYISKEDAEFLADLKGRLLGVTSIGASSTMKKLQSSIERIIFEKWNFIFGDDSPWITEDTRKGYKVIWDQKKADKLGVELYTSENNR